MSTLASVPHIIAGWRDRCIRAFFGNFFRLILIAVSVSEWGVLWWFALRLLGPLPLPVHAAGIFVFYVGNRALGGRTQRRRRDPNPAGSLPRLYYAFAFTCLFCFSFLALTWALWVTAKVSIGAIAVEARTTYGGVVLGDGVDVGFRLLTNVGVAGIALAFVYGYTVGQLRLRVTRLRLPLRNVSERLAGVRIVQISDLHIGQNLDVEQLETFVARVNALDPNLVCITGDIADGPSSDLPTFLPILAQLQSTHGVIAILGNHDHYAEADWVEAQLRAYTPFTVLRDQRTRIDVQGSPLHIIGLDDRGRDWARGFTAVHYLDEALHSIPPDEPVLLLSHRPDVFVHAARHGVALTLSGHTHGGQIGIPWFNGKVRNLAEFITPFDRGLFERHGSYLYVNCGLGVTGQRVRLCTPREITLIEAVESSTTEARAA